MHPRRAGSHAHNRATQSSHATVTWHAGTLTCTQAAGYGSLELYAPGIMEPTVAKSNPDILWYDNSGRESEICHRLDQLSRTPPIMANKDDPQMFSR
jgi:hypothetical protein